MKARHPEKDPERLPKQGSNIRRLYDALLSGEPVSAKRICGAGRALKDLKDYYSCEIVTKVGPYGGSRLLGRWIGNDFVPVERLTENCSDKPI